MSHFLGLAVLGLLLGGAAPAATQAAAPTVEELKKENSEVVRQFNAKQRALAELREAQRKGPDIEPLVKAADAAVEACRELQSKDPDIKAALAAQHRSIDDLEGTIAAELKSSQEIAAANKEVAAANDKLAAAQRELQDAQHKRDTLRRRIENASVKVIEMRKAADVALATYREVYAKKTGEAQLAAENARDALDTALKKKFAGDPKALSLDKELDALLQRNRELVAKINELLRSGE